MDALKATVDDFMPLTEEDYKTLDEDALRCLDDLHFLVTEVLYRHDAHKYGQFHRWMCETVGKIPGTRELWLLPRDHFKTTILTIGHAIQQILRDPTTAILLLSRKDDHALVWSDEIRRQFVNNHYLRALFPEFFNEITSMEQLGSRESWIFPGYKVVKGHRRREPTVTATGIKARKQSKHYNWVYPDDCMDIEDTTEVGLREIRQDWKDIIPLFDKDSGVIIPGTRKHYNDLYQGLMDTGAYKVFVRHGLESTDGKLCDTDECSRFAQPHLAPDFKNGKPVCSERMDRAAYDAKLKECEIDPKHGVSFFFHEYMNIPFSPSDRKFQPSWFVQVDDSMIPGKTPPFAPLSKWIAVDTAWKDEEHPTGYDFTVVVVGGFDDFGRLYILDVLRSRTWTAKQGCDAIVTCMKSAEYGGISRVITEKVGEVSWHNFLRDRCRTAGVPLQLLSLTRGGRGAKSKYDRIEGTQGYFEQGKIIFRKSSENFDDAVNEFCNLRRWTNDDIADAISMFFDERVIVMAPNRIATDKGWKPPVRPLGSEGGWRRAAFAAQNDPLGRFGANGPALVTQTFEDESIGDWSRVQIGGRRDGQ